MAVHRRRGAARRLPRPRPGAAGARPLRAAAGDQLRQRDRVRGRGAGRRRAWRRRWTCCPTPATRPPGDDPDHRPAAGVATRTARWPRRSTAGTRCAPPSSRARCRPSSSTACRPRPRAFDTWVKPITRSEEEVATVFLISRAEEMEQSDPAYLAELQRWLRTDPGAVDGVPVDGRAQRRSARPALELADPRFRRRRPRAAPLPRRRATPMRRRRTWSARPSCSWAPRATTATPGCRPAGRWGGSCCTRRRGAGGLTADPGAGLAGHPGPPAGPAVPGRAPADAAAHGVSARGARRRGERPPAGRRRAALRAGRRLTPVPIRRRGQSPRRGARPRGRVVVLGASSRGPRVPVRGRSGGGGLERLVAAAVALRPLGALELRCCLPGRPGVPGRAHARGATGRRPRGPDRSAGRRPPPAPCRPRRGRR